MRGVIKLPRQFPYHILILYLPHIVFTLIDLSVFIFVRIIQEGNDETIRFTNYGKKLSV